MLQIAAGLWIVSEVYNAVVAPVLGVIADLLVSRFGLLIVGGVIGLEFLGVPVISTAWDFLVASVWDPLVAWAFDTVDWAVSGFQSWLQGVIEGLLSF